MLFHTDEYGGAKKLSKTGWALLVLAALVILAGAFFAVKAVFFSAKADPTASAYSAVFLSNGQG